jgi:hypothetical protein
MRQSSAAFIIGSRQHWGIPLTIMTERRSFIQGCGTSCYRRNNNAGSKASIRPKIVGRGLDWICDEASVLGIAIDKGNTRMRRRISSLVQSRPARTADRAHECLTKQGNASCRYSVFGSLSAR